MERNPITVSISKIKCATYRQILIAEIRVKFIYFDAEKKCSPLGDYWFTLRWKITLQIAFKWYFK